MQLIIALLIMLESGDEKMIANSKYIVIFNSYQLTDKQIENAINTAIKEDGFKTKRSMQSLVAEVKTHNRLYKLGLFIKRTKDTDLESEINPILDIIYRILGA